MDDCDELSSRLWLLRQQMEQLVCALDIQQLMLSNHRLRWLPVVVENVEQVVADIRESEAARIAVSRRVASTLGLPLDAPLTEMIESVGEPYAPIWRQHRIHLLSFQAEVEELGQANQELSHRGTASTRDLIGSLTGDVLQTYDPHGGPRPLAPSFSRFDRTV
jgi:hypothetical protein